MADILKGDDPIGGTPFTSFFFRQFDPLADKGLWFHLSSKR